MSPSAIDAAAARLLEAYETRVPIQPLTEEFGNLDIEDAYEIQREQIEFFVRAGGILRGHKVGLTSAVMQRQLKVDRPDFGSLLDAMFYPEYMPIVAGTFLQPRVEPEIAFVLKSDIVGPGINVAQVLAAVECVLPSLEIIDSRIRDWKITIVDTIADNASSGGVVLGSKRTDISDLDLRLVGCTLRKQGEVVATGAGGAVLGTPVAALVWLANTLGRKGISLKAGQVILPGSVTASIPVIAGDTVTANFGNLGTVSATFG